MKQTVTKGIVLSRTDFGEADRIITVLTPEYGKVRLLAKGVRKIKSKLAGGVELFSICDLTYIQGRGEIQTLVSSRLKVHFGTIVQDIDRTMFAYEVLKTINKTTEQNVAHEYFTLLSDTLRLIDTTGLSLVLVRLWFYVMLLKLGGYTPNLHTDPSGNELKAAKSYAFSFEDMAFMAGQGPFAMQDIKLLRVLFGLKRVNSLSMLQDDAIAAGQEITPLILTMAKQNGIVSQR